MKMWIFVDMSFYVNDVSLLVCNYVIEVIWCIFNEMYNYVNNVVNVVLYLIGVVILVFK